MDKRRHSIAEVLSPSHHGKKRWSFESFSPINIRMNLHSKWKRKSHAEIDPVLQRPEEQHHEEIKTNLGSRWKRRASVAVVSEFLSDKHHGHHHSVLSLWKHRSSHETLTEQHSAPIKSLSKLDLSRRRASIAVPHVTTNGPTTISFKTPKHKTKKHKEYFLAVFYLKDGAVKWEFKKVMIQSMRALRGVMRGLIQTMILKRKVMLTVPLLRKIQDHHGHHQLQDQIHQFSSREKINGEDGSGLGELLSQVTMDQRINSYRLIMASTRAILDSDGSCGSPCVDPALEDVFEELGLQGEEDESHDSDPRYDIVSDIQKSEREYCRLLRSILDAYGEPLRKFSSLTAEDHKVLFVGIEPILSISAMLTSKLEDVLKTWETSASQIGNLFTSKFWNRYEDYLKNYSKARKLLEDRYTADQSFLEFCNLRKGQTTYNLESLLHLPVQRIPEYDKYLNDLLDETDPSHPDYEELGRATSRVKHMVKEHEDELGTSENQNKMESIQLRFPNDDLQLDDGKQQKRTSSTRRRRSAPGAILLKTLGKSKSSSNLWGNTTMGKKELDLTGPVSRQPSQENRQFILEGQVEFATGVQIQDRYMFLFNDLLLVAKQKTSTTFKLKHRVRVCEIWISECVTDVTELTRSTELSFVMGWPLCNFVATFKTLDLKQQWQSKLSEQIENERLKEQPRVIKLKVVSREISEPCTVDVDPNMEAEKVLRKCMDQSHLSDSDIKDYQMWVRYGKEDSPYPLIGHELPYSIKMSQLRDSYQSKNGDVSLPTNEEILDLDTSANVEFILKHRKSNKKLNLDETSGKSMKKPRRSPFSIFRRGKDDKNNNSSPVGKLFGRPLEDMVTEEGLPKAIMDLLRIMYREGPSTKGILRKSANSVKCKEIHDKLDEGEDCLDDNIQTLVVGAVLKEYLRSLPHCLLLEEHYNEWVAVSDQDESSAKMNRVKQLLYKLPPSNFDLLRHLICVLHRIQEKHTENMMTSYNLAVCITPSILWPKEQIKDPMASQSAHKAIMYLIDNCGPIFGEETLHLFGDDPKIRQDSSTDSDSMHSYLSAQDSGSGMRPDNSSIDSLERDLYMGELDSSPNLIKSHLSPSNLSRDSGLTLSDAQLYDDEGSIENLTDKKNYTRSVSQFMERDSEKSKYPDNVVSRSYENSYDLQNPKPPPRKHKKREYEKDNVTPNVRNTMVQSYSSEGYQKFKRNSCESLRSLDDNEPEDQFEHLRHPDFGTLIKSSSGAHLYYDDNKETANKNLRYVSEIEIQTQRTPNNGKLMRQSSVTESNPPMSPHSRLSCGSSFDSGIPHSSSCSSFMQGQSSQESDVLCSMWSSSRDDASLSSRFSSARRSGNSKTSVNYLVSPPVSPNTSRKVFDSDSTHKSLSVRRSFPFENSSPLKGSGSDSYKEAEDIIKPRFQLSAYESPANSDHLSPMLASKYGSSASANDVRSNMPLRAINKYGLGTSPPPGVILKLHQKQQKREIAPMRASHDSAILSQVRRNSTDSSGSDQKRENEHHHSELNIGKLIISQPQPLKRSESDGEMNRTLSSSPSRPDKPPSYDEACQRTFMIKHGIPLEISEQDTEKQKEASLKAKQLYEESLRKYMEEHLNSPSVQIMERKEVSRKEEVIIEQEEGDSDTTESSIEECVPRKNDPKKIYEASMKVYEQMNSKSSGDYSGNSKSSGDYSGNSKSSGDYSGNSKSSGDYSGNKDSSLLSVNLHRSFSDSSDHMNKLGLWSQRSPTREKSPLANERRSVETSRNSSPSTQLNYSSSSVSNSSSDTVTENQQIPPYNRERSDSSPVTSRHYFPKTSAQTYSAQPQRRSSNDQTHNSSSKYSIQPRDSTQESSFLTVHEQRETTVARDSSKPRFFSGASRASSVDGQESTPNRKLSATVNQTKIESKSSITWKSKRDSANELPWSVKNLRSVYDKSNSSSLSSSQTSETRPPPPPYQPPPPFRRDNARMSSSSNSSCSSSNTDSSANIPQNKSSLSHRRLGGPQARDSFSDDSDTSSRSSGQLKNVSEHETWTYLDTEVTFV